MLAGQSNAKYDTLRLRVQIPRAGDSWACDDERGKVWEDWGTYAVTGLTSAE